jgi:hypothetical protein
VAYSAEAIQERQLAKRWDIVDDMSCDVLAAQVVRPTVWRKNAPARPKAIAMRRVGDSLQLPTVA